MGSGKSPLPGFHLTESSRGRDKERTSCPVSLPVRTLIPSWGPILLTSAKLITSQRPPTSKYHHIGVWASTSELRGDRILSTTPTRAKQVTSIVPDARQQTGQRLRPHLRCRRAAERGSMAGRSFPSRLVPQDTLLPPALQRGGPGRRCTYLPARLPAPGKRWHPRSPFPGPARFWRAAQEAWQGPP